VKYKKSILILLLNFCLKSCAQEKICADFKIGSFEYSDPKFSEWKVNRTDSTQTEISSKSRIEIHSSIEWKTDCEYILTYKKVLNFDAKEIIGKTITVKILETKSDRYTCISKSGNTELNLEMVKTD
jgi:hypothetical protein